MLILALVRIWLSDYIFFFSAAVVIVSFGVILLSIIVVRVCSP